MSSDDAAHGSGLPAPVSRRAVLGGLSLLPLAAAVAGILPAASAETAYLFLSPHQAAVLDAATRRLVPGPEDDLQELGHPGAHEAHVVRYLDRLLSVFDVTPADVHAGGPWSNRAGGSQDFMADFVPLNRAQTYAWQIRVADLRGQYTNGIALLDQLAGGDFTSVPKIRQDWTLALGQAVPFTSLLFGHTIEAMYANPEYGGNAGLVGWRDIYFPGDSQPRGYTDAEVEATQFDPVGIPPNGIIDRLLNGGWEQVVAKRVDGAAYVANKAIVVGSGAGGSVVAMELAEAGWDVVIFEKGSNYFTNLEGNLYGRTTFSNDELKALNRYFEQPDPLAYPRTYRQSAGQDASYVGSVNELPVTVGGGTVHWDAKVPRFWDIDFKGLSLLGPQPGADMADWPFEYSEIAPYYDEIEVLLGTQGDVASIPALTLKHAPRSRPYPMPPGAQQRSSTLIAGGAKRLGLHPYPFPMAINSVPHDGRAACNNCGFCSDYGCPIGARVGALGPLRRALRTGRVHLRPETTVTKVEHTGRRATGVSYVDPQGNAGGESADLVVLAASAIESARLTLLSDLPDASGRVGTRLMFHNFVDGFGIYLFERVHAYRGRSTTQCMEDFADPDFPGARAFARLNGLPYIRGGLCELGGSQDPIAEGQFYQEILGLLPGLQFFGHVFKELMRASILRDRLAGVNFLGTDLPYLSNNVTLDPTVTDLNGQPAPRITYALGQHEQVAQTFYLIPITAMIAAAGATLFAAVPDSLERQVGGGTPPDTKHVMGGMQMGVSPQTSVVDPNGRMHQMDNVYVADGSVFVTSGCQNPTNTLMAVALRTARGLTGKR